MSRIPGWYDTAEFGALAGFVAEGACDAVCGRPRDRNPYSASEWSAAYAAWELGWTYGRGFLETRVESESRRWLAEAA